jgi:hypothetical protein
MERVSGQAVSGHQSVLGELDGVPGIFPRSYVNIIVAPPATPLSTTSHLQDLQLLNVEVSLPLVDKI